MLLPSIFLLRFVLMRHSIQSRTLAVELFIECNRSYHTFVTQWNQRQGLPAPSRKTLLRLLDRFRSSGNVVDLHRSGRKRTRNDELVIAIGAYFTAHTNASVNQFMKESGDVVSRSTVLRVLKADLKWKPFRPRRVHRLIDGDDRQRYWCCHFFLEKMKLDPTFLSNIIWSDECSFKLNGKIISNNVVNWGPVNPHYTYQQSTNRNGIMVFAAISILGIVAIGFFDEMESNTNRKIRNSVNKDSYKEMLKVKLLPGISQLYPESERGNLYFMQDGAPSHRIPEFLNVHFKSRWIGNVNHGAPVHWPSRSPDITPMGKFFYFKPLHRLLVIFQIFLFGAF